MRVTIGGDDVPFPLNILVGLWGLFVATIVLVLVTVWLLAPLALLGWLVWVLLN